MTDSTNDNERFWHNRWETGQIGFHEGKVNGRLERHHEALLGHAASARVLVPLSGKSVDLAWLAERGHKVVGCELVERAARSFFAEVGVSPSESRREPFLALEAQLGPGTVTILVGDVLLLEPRHCGPIDAVFDRAALVALPSELRPRYAKLIVDLLHPGARILLVAFEHDAGSGPPHSVEEPEVRSLYTPRCDVRLIERDDILAESAHIAAKGATRVHEAVYLNTVS